MSVDNTTLYLYIKIIYFVRATCFDLIRSSSGPPRRHPRVVYVSLHCGIRNAYKFLLEKCKIHKLHIQAYVFYTSLTKNCKHLGSHSAMKHKQLSDLSSWRAWGWPYKVKTCRPAKIYYFCIEIKCSCVIDWRVVFICYNISGWKT